MKNRDAWRRHVPPSRCAHPIRRLRSLHACALRCAIPQEAAGYVHPMDSPGWRERPVFLQSFERSNLIAAAARSKLPMAFMLDEFWRPIYGGENTTFGDIIRSKAELEKVRVLGRHKEGGREEGLNPADQPCCPPVCCPQLKAQGITAIGAWKDSLLPMAENNTAPYLDLQVGFGGWQGLLVRFGGPLTRALSSMHSGVPLLTPPIAMLLRMPLAGAARRPGDR